MPVCVHRGRHRRSSALCSLHSDTLPKRCLSLNCSPHDGEPFIGPNLAVEIMRQHGIGAALLMVVLMASTSGCMGLIAARESVESLRDPPFESLKNSKVSVSHEFTTILNYTEEFNSRSTFSVDDQTTEIEIYFKVTFEFSRNLPANNDTRYVKATLTDSEGNVQWEQDVSEDASVPVQVLQPTPSFAQGEWELDVRARGGGESTFGTIQDKFVVILTITNTCIQYPLVEDCS